MDLIRKSYDENEINAEIRKSAAAGQPLVRTTCLRRTQTGRGQMDVTERFMRGGAAYGMTTEVVEVLMTPEIRDIVRARLMEMSPGALPALDAGTIDEHVLLRALPEAVEVEPEAAHEPMVKSGPGPHAFVRDGDGSCLSCFRAEGDELHCGVKKSLEPGRYPSVGGPRTLRGADEPARRSAAGVVRTAYGAAVDSGAISLKAAAAELSALCDRISKSR